MECKCCFTRFSSSSNLTKHRRSRPDTCGQPEYDSPGKSMKRKSFRKGRKRDSDDDTTTEESDSDDDIPLASRLKTKLKQESQNSDSGDECPDFEPNNSEDDADASGFQLPPPAILVLAFFKLSTNCLIERMVIKCKFLYNYLYTFFQICHFYFVICMVFIYT